MHLRQPEPLRMLNHHHARVRHIDTDFDHRGRDQHIGLAALKAPHRDFLVIRVHPPVQQPQPQSGQRPRTKLVVHLCSRSKLCLRKQSRRPCLLRAPFHRSRIFIRILRKVQLRLIILRAFDHRVHDISLPPQRDLLAHKVPDLRRLLLARAPRHNRRTTGRQLVDHTHIHVAVDRQRQRPRNRRSSHHQHIRVRNHARRIRLLHQLEPLLHAETMLLVHHHQPQVREVDLLFDQRVRSDGKLSLPAKDPASSFALSLFVQRARQQRHPVRLARQRRHFLRQQLARAQIMLRRQDLRRCHQRHLVAVLNRNQRRLHRHDRLAGADVALQQPVHRARAGLGGG